MACGAVIGFLGARSYPLAAALVLLYGLFIWLDSSSLTAGAAGSAAVDASLGGADIVMFGSMVKVPAFYIMALPEIKSVEDLRGKPDLFGYQLQVTTIGLADQIASAVREGPIST